MCVCVVWANLMFAATTLAAHMLPSTGSWAFVHLVVPAWQFFPSACRLTWPLGIQAAVYTVRAGKGGARRVKARSCHAPARRLARTTISLGPEEGILFGLRAIRCEILPT